MAEEKWQKVREIFDSALCRNPEERRKFVREACGEDKALLAEVESLLASLDSAESFMETPAVAKVASVIAAETKKLKTGRCFGHYEIIKQIGAGGMGEVYLARDLKLNRRVALKVLPENLCAETEANQRLLREAQAAATLDHPNICQIYEIAEVGDYSFIVMQYVEGETLAEKLGKEKLSVQTSLELAAQIAEALEEAHAHHIIHRDIKPANIIVNEKGRAKVLDFGLAKFIETENEETAKRLSKPGAIMGTAPYMSPEQACGDKLDARTDIFSFGALVYEMLSGRQPFARENNAETIAAILNDEPSWQETPSKLQSIVKKSLAKNRDERYQTAGDLVRELRELQHSGVIPIVTDSRFFDAETADLPKNPTKDIAPAATQRIIDWRSFRLPILAGLICVVVLAGFGLYHLFNRDNSPADFRNLNLTRLTSSGKTKLAAVSPDGKFVAHVQQSGENQSLRLRQIASDSETQIIAPASIEIRAVNFSPNGNLIYYIIGETGFRGTLFQISTLGGQPKKVLDNIYLPKLAVNGIGFAPGGKQIAFVRLSQPPNDTSFLMIADADGTNERALISYKRPDLLHGTPAWSPNGETIVCPFQNTNGMNAIAIKVAQPDSIAPILPVELNAVSQIVWMPDGQSLLMVAEDDTETVLNQIYQVAYPNGERLRVNKDFNNYDSISLTADGREIVAVRTEQTAHLWTMPANDANRLKQLTGGFEKYDGINGLGWLLDGRIFYESMSGGKQAILQIDPDGGEGKQMAAGGGYGSVSPDGRFLAYQKSSVKDNRLAQGLFLFDTLDGSERQLTTGWDIWATFSPDGKSINFIRWGEDEAMATLRSVSAEGGEPVRLTKFLAITAAASADRKSIAVARWNGAKTQIVIIPAGGGEPTRTFDVDFNIQDRFGKRAIQWAPDGRGIYFIRESKGVSNIWRQSIDGGDPLPVTNFTSDLIFNFAFSPNGQQLALSRGTINSDVILINNHE
jgi:serine/threonine protein kinase